MKISLFLGAGSSVPFDKPVTTQLKEQLKEKYPYSLDPPQYLSHFPIDMNLVKNFSKRLFVSIMSAGFYDPEFAGILKYKLKNIAEIVKKYNELSEPLKIIHNADTTAKWLEENQLLMNLRKFTIMIKALMIKNIIKYQISFQDCLVEIRKAILVFRILD